MPTILDWKIEATPQEVERLQAYRTRLQTYSPATFFGKPVALSPIVCARHGWRNVTVDGLLCDFCQASLSVPLPASLSVEATNKLVALYREQVEKTGHASACWRIVVPEPLPLTHEEVEVATASIEKLFSVLVAEDHPLPKVVVRVNDDPTIEENHGDRSNQQQPSSSAAHLLARWGWKAVDPAPHDSCCLLECPHCLALVSLLPTDRHRYYSTLDPQQAHRYYCPTQHWSDTTS